MPETQVQSPETAQGGGKQSNEPVLTGDVKSRSDKKMASLMGGIAKSAPRYQTKFASEKGIPLPNSVAERVASGGDKGGGAAPEPPKNGSETSQPPVESQQAATDDKQKDGTQETPKPEQQSQKKDGSVDWEQESKKHQSRADKIQKEFEDYRKQNEPEFKKLKEDNQRLEGLVSQFQQDPVTFINKYLPGLGEQLAAARDPIQMIEYQVGKFKESLDSEFKKQYGEDWRYQESEALKPGTPSFRYRLAIESKISEIRDGEARKVQSARQRFEDAEAQKARDIARLKEEFNLTDEDIQEGQKFLDSEKITPYNLLKLALFDKILKKQLDSIVPPPAPPKDITETRGSVEVAQQKPDNQLSPEGMRVLGRIGTRRIR